jgi:hypothetical protein
MGVVTRWRLGLNRTTVVWLLSACALFAPSKLHAGCTHTWVRRDASTTQILGLELLTFADGRTVLPGERPAPANDDSPCAHGRCSPTPDLPVDTPSRLDPGNELRALPPSSLGGLHIASRLFGIREAHLTPIRLTDRIDRPPRLRSISGGL